MACLGLEINSEPAKSVRAMGLDSRVQSELSDGKWRREASLTHALSDWDNQPQIGQLHYAIQYIHMYIEMGE